MTVGDIVKRLEEATGPDRELDVLIGAATGLEIDGMSTSFTSYVDVVGIDRATQQAESWQSILRTGLPRYTASVDAALGLVERLHGEPGQSTYPVEMTFSTVGYPTKEKPWRCAVWVGSNADGVYRIGTTPAIAILLAALRAKEPQP